MSQAQVTLGCVVTPDLHPRGFLEVARAAEAGGLEELWLWEDCLKQSAVATAGAMLGATRQLRVGIGLLPVPLTTLRQPTQQIGEVALGVMLERVARSDFPPRDVLLHCELVVRESCGGFMGS